MTTRLMAAAALVLGLFAAAAYAEQVDSQAYSAWAKFKPGAMVKYEQATKAAGQDVPGTMTMTLKEVTPDHVTVEMTMSMNMGGQVMTMPAQTQTIPAKVEKGDPMSGEPPADAKVETGEETVEAAGQSYDTKRTKTSMTHDGQEVVATVWQSDAVPGGMVKMHSTVGDSMTTTMTLVEVKAE